MKKMLLLTVLMWMLFVPALAFAGEVVGTVQGLQCVTTGKTCPIGKEDPVIAAERVFVVLTAEGDYYFVPNLDRAIMARNITEQVKVTGPIDNKYRSITAKTFQVWQDDGKWKKTWSEKMENEMLEKLYGDGN